MSQSTRNIAQYLELSKLQMTAEAFWDQWTNKKGYSKKLGAGFNKNGRRGLGNIQRNSH